ncbi:MAG: hypothetical protein E7523_01715 [Ruminococcaceae bacterium]|nr:hypothetical protein [Oscillospiraceae bacterium]
MFRKTISLLLCLLFLIACMGGCTFLMQDEQPTGGETNSVDATELVDDDGKIKFKKLFVESKTATLPLMKTDFDGIFYTMDISGNVNFYKLTDGILAQLEENGVYSVSPRCSGQNIPAQVHYITVDGKTNGFGLYTAANNSGVLLFDYAFFKICDLPDYFADEDELLLLVDTDKTRFYGEKLYSEQFYLDTEDMSTSYFLSEAQRHSGMDGLKVKDYKMFTDEILHQPYKNVYFFTSRAYVADDVKLVDIYTSGGYDTNIDNIRVVRNMLGMTFYRTNEGIYYYSAEDEGFVTYFYDGEDYTVVRNFEGNLETDYFRSGTATLEKNSGIIYDLASNKEYTIDYSVFGTAFVASDFVMNGRYAAVIGESPIGGVQIGVLDTEDGNLTVFKDFSNKNMEQIHITDDGYLVISVCYKSDYTAFQLICNMNRF